MAYTRLHSLDDGDHGHFDIEKAISDPSTTKKSLETSHIWIDFESKHPFLASWRLLIVNLVLLAACLGWLVFENRRGVCSPKMVSTYCKAANIPKCIVEQYADLSQLPCSTA